MRNLLVVLLITAAALSSGCQHRATPRDIVIGQDGQPSISVEGGQIHLTRRNAANNLLVEQYSTAIDRAWKGRALDTAYYKQELAAAQTGVKIQPATGLPEGALPVVFINKSRYRYRTYTYWYIGTSRAQAVLDQTNSRRESVEVSPGSQQVRHLRSGFYALTGMDEYGKHLEFKMDGKKVTTATFEVHQAPFFEWPPNSRTFYHGYFRSQ